MVLIKLSMLLFHSTTSCMASQTDTHSFYIDVHWITQHASVLAGPAWLNGARMEWVIYTLFVSTCYHVVN